MKSKEQAYQAQVNHRAKQKERGLRQILLWIPQDKSEEIKLTAKEMRDAHFKVWGNKQ